MTNLTKAKAAAILGKHVSQEHLILHAKSVSAAMGAMALYFGEEKEHWEAVGYLHDVDYEKFPKEHCQHMRELLADEAVAEEDIRAIISHGYGLCTQEVPPLSNMEKSLFTVDELTGIVMASALMRPSGIADMDLKSLKKKFKDKRFAAKCSREVIASGFELLGLTPDVVMQCCIDGMREHKAELGI